MHPTWNINFLIYLLALLLRLITTAPPTLLNAELTSSQSNPSKKSFSPLPTILPICRNVSYNPFLNIKQLGSGYLSIPIMTISDMDQQQPDLPNYIYRSPSVRAYLIYNLERNDYKFEWSSAVNYYGRLSYENRAMELSDMKVFDQRLLVPCDRTGVVYWLNGKKAVPWIINADGNGSSDEKPFKAEWMTIKDEKLWVGGVGKEWTTENGSVEPLIGLNSFYIKVIFKNGYTQHLNWQTNYNLLRLALGTPFPGYLVHEAIQWSDVHQKWFVLPRKHSSEPFDEVDSQIKGVNFMLVASEDFSLIEIVPLLNKTAVDTRLGFSAFQFLPGTSDQVIVALKTLEVDDSPLASYIVVLDVTGNILYEETKIDGEIKQEGIEFVDWSNLYWNQ